MAHSIALAGNPNSGKTSIFNELTGSLQYVGNWPGVTVEKKEGYLKNDKRFVVVDLPGIYSLSPYTLEEVVTRDYLIDGKPDLIIDVVDATNLERNLYLTTQLIETGIPVLVALNMIDLVHKNKDKIDIKKLSDSLGCPVIETSAVTKAGLDDLVRTSQQIIERATGHGIIARFSEPIEAALKEIENLIEGQVTPESERWFTIKLFERDVKVLERLHLSEEILANIEKIIVKIEEELDDSSEGLITNDRYEYIETMIMGCYKKGRQTGELTISDKIDRILTNRWLALPSSL